MDGIANSLHALRPYSIKKMTIQALKLPNRPKNWHTNERANIGDLLITEDNYLFIQTDTKIK
jgi:hypothetical protein